MSLTFSAMLDAIEKRARYRRTVQELKAMPLDVALDLDIYHGDAERIAERAVYGEPPQS